MPWDETDQYIRSGHQSTEKFDKDSMRTKTISSKEGIKAITGCPEGNYSGVRCKVGLEVVSYLFSKDKGWSMDKAKSWFEDHKEDTKRSKQRTKEKRKSSK